MNRTQKLRMKKAQIKKMRANKIFQFSQFRSIARSLKARRKTCLRTRKARCWKRRQHARSLRKRPRKTITNGARKVEEETNWHERYKSIWGDSLVSSISSEKLDLIFMLLSSNVAFSNKQHQNTSLCYSITLIYLSNFQFNFKKFQFNFKNYIVNLNPLFSH